MKRRSLPSEVNRLLTIVELHMPYLQNAARAYDGQAEHHYQICTSALLELRKLFPKEP